MHFRTATVRLAACLSLLAALSCGGDGFTGAGVGPAFVMFLDLTNMSLRISANGITDTGGNGVYCLDIDRKGPTLR